MHIFSHYVELIHVTFLSPNKKVTKEIGIGEARSAGQLPAGNPVAALPVHRTGIHYRDCASLTRARAALPCVPHPARTYDGAKHLNLHPEHSKNVPIFAMQAGAVQYRQGGESGAAANSKSHP